jgi:predicted amidohydrolase
MGIIMIWIPIVYLCLATAQCAFVQGNPTYTEKSCMEQLLAVAQYAKERPDVVLFDATCVPVSSV